MFNKSLYEELLMSSQYKLIYDTLPNKLRELGYNDINHVGDNLFCIGNVPVMLVAHADSVMTNNEYPKNFIYKDGIVRANQRTLGSDDRNGIYIMLEAIKDLDVKPFLLVTHDEEQGCKGSDEFVTKMPYNEYDICFAIEGVLMTLCSTIAVQNKSLLTIVNKLLDINKLMVAFQIFVA